MSTTVRLSPDSHRYLEGVRDLQVRAGTVLGARGIDCHRVWLEAIAGDVRDSIPISSTSGED